MSSNIVLNIEKNSKTCISQKRFLAAINYAKQSERVYTILKYVSRSENPNEPLQALEGLRHYSKIIPKINQSTEQYVINEMIRRVTQWRLKNN